MVRVLLGLLILVQVGTIVLLVQYRLNDDPVEDMALGAFAYSALVGQSLAAGAVLGILAVFDKTRAKFPRTYCVLSLAAGVTVLAAG